jgi:hypothetical protein
VTKNNMKPNNQRGWFMGSQKEQLRTTEVSVTLSGIRPIMFDRYSGDNSVQLPPEQKVYLSPTDGKTLVLPCVNIMSFLSSQNTESATSRVLGKSWKAAGKAALSFVSIEPMDVPFTRNGKALTIDNAGLVVKDDVARIVKGKLVVPSPKHRPVLNTPWELSFKVSLYNNPNLDIITLKRIFIEGGIAIGLGTFRGVYGKFHVAKWE